jgi:hypothetical protein
MEVLAAEIVTPVRSEDGQTNLFRPGPLPSGLDAVHRGDLESCAEVVRRSGIRVQQPTQEPVHAPCA